MEPFRRYRKKQWAEMRPYVVGEDLAIVTVSDGDRLKGSPKGGDMIARNPADPADQWLVEAQFFTDNYALETSIAAAVAEPFPEPPDGKRSYPPRPLKA